MWFLFLLLVLAQHTMTFNLTSPNYPARDRLNDRLVREVYATGSTSYTTGGDPIDADDLGMSEFFGVYGLITNGTAILLLWWDYTNQKLMAFVPNTGVEVANGTNLSGYTGNLFITGK